MTSRHRKQYTRRLYTALKLIAVALALKLALQFLNNLVDSNQHLPQELERQVQLSSHEQQPQPFTTFVGLSQQQQQEQQQQQQQLQENGHTKVGKTDQEPEQIETTSGPYSIDHLLKEMGQETHFWWIKKRIRQLWSELKTSAYQLRKNYCTEWKGRKLRVMFVPGVLTLTNFAEPSVINRGGPLGELTQWADLIAGCYALCHRLLLRPSINDAVNELRLGTYDTQRNGSSTGCDDTDYVDMIFTDISALKNIPADILNAYRYKFRVLDVYGTEAVYNDVDYVRLHPSLKPDADWGQLQLKLKQFYTLYPHSPDNSFLGFVVPHSQHSNVTQKEHYALIMGKEGRYLAGKTTMLKTVLKFLPLRATMRPVDVHPDLSIFFYGVVDKDAYQDIISKAKVCIGLGDPVESPSVLEALARGCVFLNPRRTGDESSFHGKPTSRQIASQVTYFEQFIGAPHTYTVDCSNITELQDLLADITNSSKAVEPYIPTEFTAAGFLQRLDAYMTHQNFCDNSLQTIWPPPSSLQTLLSPAGKSCVQTCFDKGLVCEPEYFRLVNNVTYIASHAVRCNTVQYEAEPYIPALIPADGAGGNNGSVTCQLQSRWQLFSCASSHPQLNAVRVCPCRTFLKHQIALCENC